MAVAGLAHSALRYPSSRNAYFMSSVARLPLCSTAAVPPASSVSYSAASEDDSQQLALAQAAPSPEKDRHPVMLESGIQSSFSIDAACHIATLETLQKNMDKLELVLMQTNEESYRNDLSSNEASLETRIKYKAVEAKLCRVQRLLVLRESSLNISLSEATKLKAVLQETEACVASLNMYKEANKGRQAEELLRLEKSSCNSLDILNRQFVANEAISNGQEKVQKVWESIINSCCSSDYMKLIRILQKEASLSFETLLMATKELEQEKGNSQNLLSQHRKSVNDLKERDFHISRLQHELANANRETDTISKVLARSEAEVSSLREKLINTQGLLEKERKALRAARDGLEKLDQALNNEESKVDDLFKEASSLKEQLEQQEQIVARLTGELQRNRGLEETTRKHLQALGESQKKVEQLTVQCSNLEDQIRSRDMLLDEIKNEAVKSTKALKLAAQIKQDLNLSKQREVQLTQDLETERSKAKDLSRELMENSRAVRAELALQQAEKDMNDLRRELVLFKNGIQSRNDVIKLLEEKIEGNIHLLKSASEDRETMRRMQVYIETLESKLRELMLTL